MPSVLQKSSHRQAARRPSCCNTESKGQEPALSESGYSLNKRQLQARLLERGSNFRQFALEHGYKPRTVTQAVERWVGKDTLPQGRLTFQILRQLSEAAGYELVPGILKDGAEHVVSQ